MARRPPRRPSRRSVIQSGVSIGSTIMAVQSPAVAQFFGFRGGLAIGVSPPPPPPPGPPPPPPPPSPPPPPPGTPSFQPITGPSDGLGWLNLGQGGTGANNNEKLYLFPAVTAGQRLSGTVSIGFSIGASGSGTSPLPAGNPARLLLDGVPLTTFGAGPFSIDTTTLPDGNHALGAQLLNPPPPSMFGQQALPVVINNSGVPIQTLNGQVLCGWAELSFASGGCGTAARVNVLNPQPYPVDVTANTRVVATDGSDTAALEDGIIWWVQDALGQNGILYMPTPWLVKNTAGDWFLISYPPPALVNGSDAPLTQAPAVWILPQLDGPRGQGWISPYTTIIPDLIANTASGITDFLFVDLAGRLGYISMPDMAITTIFGPRSVPNVVPTWPTQAVSPATRIANGEKVNIGTGPFLGVSTDLYVLPSDTDKIVISDLGNGKIQTFSRASGSIVSGKTRAGVTSVWYGIGHEWSVDGTNLWQDDTQFSAIPKCYWVRGNATDNFIYVLTADMSLYSVDPVTGFATQRATNIATGGPITREFAFMAVDEFGTIGPKGAVYISSVNTDPGNNNILYTVPSEWGGGVVLENWMNPAQNHVRNCLDTLGTFQTNMNATADIGGHYPWLLAMHRTWPVWLSAGTANQGWHFGVAFLNALPPKPLSIATSNPGAYVAGRALWAGTLDKTLGPGAAYGYMGGGSTLGYTARQFQGQTIAQIQATLTTLLAAWGYTATQLNQMAVWIWTQRDANPFSGL